jgi:hypothetical protein
VPANKHEALSSNTSATKKVKYKKIKLKSRPEVEGETPLDHQYTLKKKKKERTGGVGIAKG